MKLVQVSLKVPDKFYKGFKAGKYTIQGVVRDDNGRIRKHLKKLNHSEGSRKDKILHYLMENRRILLGFLIGSLVGTAFFMLIRGNKKKGICSK